MEIGTIYKLDVQKTKANNLPFYKGYISNYKFIIKTEKNTLYKVNNAPLIIDKKSIFKLVESFYIKNVVPTPLTTLYEQIAGTTSGVLYLTALVAGVVYVYPLVISAVLTGKLSSSSSLDTATSEIKKNEEIKKMNLDKIRKKICNSIYEKYKFSKEIKLETPLKKILKKVKSAFVYEKGNYKQMWFSNYTIGLKNDIIIWEVKTNVDCVNSFQKTNLFFTK